MLHSGRWTGVILFQLTPAQNKPVCLHVLPAVGWRLEGLLAVGAHVRPQVTVSGHVAPQAAAGGESGVAHEALVSFQARVGPDVSFEDSRRGEAPAALHALEGSLSRMGPGGMVTGKKMNSSV